MDLATIMSLRKPLTWAGRKLLALAGALTVEPIYRQAHQHHLALRNWQCRWVEMADGIEYRLHTRSSFDEGNTDQFIEIRNAGQTFIDEIRFCVEAKLGSRSYQVPLEVLRIRPGRTVIRALHELPLQDLAIHENRIFATYESLHVYPVRVLRNHRVETYATDGIAQHPVHGDFCHAEWKRWNGRLYNTKAIADVSCEILIRLKHSFCGRYGLYDIDASRLISQALRTKRYRRIPGILAFALTSSKPMLSAIVWSRLLLRIERLSFECDAPMLAAQEYVLDKGQGARPVHTEFLSDASRTTIDQP